jgi:aminoglycoside phosphotransferase (APT) family kinase protein
MRPLDGGFSGETFLAEVAGERSVVRVYGARGAARGPGAAEIDAAVMGLVRGLVPVPEVLELRRGDPDAGTPGLLVTSFVPGERLDLALPAMSAERRARAGRSCGEIAARLACMPMRRSGLFADADLRIDPMPEDYADLGAHADRVAPRLGLGPAGRRALAALAGRSQERLDRFRRACLVHSDLNPKNLLVDPGTGAVTAVLDWEFAHAGVPVTDVGNLLRHDRGEGFAAAVLAAFRGGVPDLADRPDDELLADARAADLWAVLDLATRRAENPAAAAAYDLLVGMLSS